MLSVDFHSHTFFSGCGIHSHIEMLTAARARGMAGLAITDHGPAAEGRLNSTFFERLKDPLPGIRLLKGMECNLLDEEGNIDVLFDMLPFMDVVLLGVHDIHERFKVRRDRENCTAALLRAMERNRFIDIITHPEDPKFSLDLRRIAEKARELGMALELNNSKASLSRYDQERTSELILTCKSAGCRIVVDSDAHAANEVGSDDAVAPLLEKSDFPAALLVNRDAASAFAFVEERRALKLKEGRQP